MTIYLSEVEVERLLRMDEVIDTVEEAFRRQGKGEAFNSPRTRTIGHGAALNVMHAVLPYLGRGGLKAYMSTAAGTKFVIVLFDARDSRPLAVMGADMLGRFRTGAASGVATRHMYRRPSAVLAIFGTGRQALTQVLAVSSVLKLDEVRAWSPDSAHRAKFATDLSVRGVKAVACASPAEAADGADVGSAISSSKDPFLSKREVKGMAHLNLCGGNNPAHSEIVPDAVASFRTVAVDDVPQGMKEYGDLIKAASSGCFDWADAVPLSSIVDGSVKPDSPSLFKSGGAALEDIAVASLVYDKALESGRFTNYDLV